MLIVLVNYISKKAGFDVYFEHKEYPGISRVTNEKDENGKFVGLFPESELGWHNNGNWRIGNTLLRAVLLFIVLALVNRLLQVI